MSLARRPPTPDPDAPHRRASIMICLAVFGLIAAVVAAGVLVWIIGGG